MLGKLVPWFFSMGTLTMHDGFRYTLEILSLRKSEIQIYIVNSRNGKFMISKTLNAFSKMAIDQAHEQENERIKGDGGAVGLTEGSCGTSSLDGCWA